MSRWARARDDDADYVRVPKRPYSLARDVCDEYTRAMTGKECNRHPVVLVLKQPVVPGELQKREKLEVSDVTYDEARNVAMVTCLGGGDGNFSVVARVSAEGAWANDQLWRFKFKTTRETRGGEMTETVLHGPPRV